MLSVNLDTLWYDDAEPAIKGIDEATHNILAYTSHHIHTLSQLQDICNDIYQVCHLWCAHTIVGRQKPKNIETAFQSFFTALMTMLMQMKNSNMKEENDIASELLYQGTVYRYLGTGYFSSKYVIPKYNDIYVSWSKKPRNSYFESKLLSPITWMACEIKEPRYGINLSAICNFNGEQEVVFPTIEECITETKYISEDDDDKT